MECDGPRQQECAQCSRETNVRRIEEWTITCRFDRKPPYRPRPLLRAIRIDRNVLDPVEAVGRFEAWRNREVVGEFPYRYPVA